MPKSKRNRPVTLSKTKKKPGLERKGKVVTEIKDAVEHYSSAYVFTYDNMRNQKLKDLRYQFKSSSRIFLAGKKVMQIALGRSAADEAKTGLHKLSKFLQVDSGLFFTNLPRDDVERLFREFEEHDFARTGSVATETVELKEGPLEQFTHEMEPFLRKQGLPVRLNKGVVELVADHVVCEEGKPFSPEAVHTLCSLGMQMRYSCYPLSAAGLPMALKCTRKDWHTFEPMKLTTPLSVTVEHFLSSCVRDSFCFCAHCFVPLERRKSEESARIVR